MMKRTCKGCRAWVSDYLHHNSEPHCRLGYPVEIKYTLYRATGFAGYVWDMKPKVECPKPKSFTKMFEECDKYKGEEVE